MSEQLRRTARADFDVIGESRPRVDSWNKSTGQAEYAGDLDRSQLAYARLKRSTEPHARIEAVETDRAEALDGVLAVITGTDLPVEFGIMPASEDETALAVDKVRYVGEPIAAVAAVDERTADRAVDLIDVTYDPLDSVTSIEGSLSATGEPIHRDAGEAGNADRVVSLEFGDVGAAFADATHVREDVFFYEGNSHVPLEQHSALASWDRSGEKLTVWASTQIPHYLHRTLASVLGLPERRIRVHANTVGGGFGGKSDPFPHQLCVAKLSMELGRPVKITLTREEVFYAHRGRHPVLMWVKSGLDDRGRFAAMDFKTYLDGGAYSSFGPATTYYTGALQPITYRLPNYRFRGVRVNTNKPPCGPKRGHGTPQPRFALELHMNRLADDIGVDPIAFRRRNFTGSDELTANWLEITTNGLDQCVDEVLAAADWDEKRGSLPDGRGIGFAVGSYLTGAGLPIYWNDMPHSEVQIKVDRSGGITAYSGAAEIGQGSDSVLAAIVAEVFGVEPEDVSLVVADTDRTPVDLGSYSSRVTIMMGNAAREAAEAALDPIQEAVGAELGIDADELVARGGRVHPVNEPGAGVSLAEAVRLTEERFGPVSGTGSYTPPEHPGEYKGAGVGPSPCYSFSAAVIQVEVDSETGAIDVDQVWLAHDIGKALNPMSVEGQVEGCVYMGLSEALQEAQTFVGEGLHRGPSLLDYKTLTPHEMPDIETILVETDEPRGPFGAKEAGQGPLLPVMPALADAVNDAVDVRIGMTPITPRTVLQAMEGDDVGPTSVPDFTFPEPTRVDVPDGVRREPE